LDTHAVEGGHVNDVEATAPIHEHLVHSFGAEQWCHHEEVYGMWSGWSAQSYVTAVSDHRRYEGTAGSMW
jgi:hypothetical protein